MFSKKFQKSIVMLLYEIDHLEVVQINNLSSDFINISNFYSLNENVKIMAMI